MANTFLPRESCANINNALIAMATHLCSGVTGPGWTLIGAYSSNNSAFEVPVSGNALSALPDGNGWKTGTLATGDYIIFESASVAGKFELGIEYQASDTIRFILAPFGGFNVGGAVADMTDAGNWTGPKLSALDISPTTTNPTYYNLVTNPDRLIFWTNDEVTSVANMRFFYAGKTLDNHTGHDNSAVMFYYNQYIRMDNSGVCASNQFSGVSAVDDTTVINLTAQAPYDITNGVTILTHSTNVTKDTATGEWRLFPIYLDHVGPDAHTTYWGKLDGVYSAYKGIGYMGQGTIASKDYAWIKNSDANVGAVAIEWDGATALNN